MAYPVVTTAVNPLARSPPIPTNRVRSCPHPVRRPKVIVTRRWPASVEDALSARFDARLNADDHPFSPRGTRGCAAQCGCALPHGHGLTQRRPVRCEFARTDHRQLRRGLQPHRYRCRPGLRDCGNQHAGCAHRLHRGPGHDADSHVRAPRRGKASGNCARGSGPVGGRVTWWEPG